MASAEEIEAEAEGVKIMYLVAPYSIVAENNKVVAINMCNQVLSEKGTTCGAGEVSGADFHLPCGTVIYATGQRVEEKAYRHSTGKRPDIG